MAILNGTDVKVYNSAETLLVAFAQSGTLNVSMSTRDITNKESGGYKEVLEGLREWSIDIDGAYAWTHATGAALANGADDMLNTYILSRTALTIKFGTVSTGTGDVKYSGSAFLTSFSVSAGTEDTATYSLSFEGTGALTQGVS